MRSEDDLRAAFQAKAADAPRADEVLHAVHRKVHREPHRSPRRRAWLVPAAAVAVAAAIGVPLGIGLSHGGETKKARPAMAASGAPVGSASQGRSADSSAGGAGSANGSVSVPVPKAPGPLESPEVCRPDQVTVTIRRGVDEATLTVTSRGARCALGRVPQVQWPDAGRTYHATPAPTTEGSPGQGASVPGVLRPERTATATLRWTGNCAGPSGDVVRVDWGAGPVEVRAGATSGCAGFGGLRVGAFTGLS